MDSRKKLGPNGDQREDGCDYPWEGWESPGSVTESGREE